MTVPAVQVPGGEGRGEGRLDVVPVHSATMFKHCGSFFVSASIGKTNFFFILCILNVIKWGPGDGES